MYRKRKTSIFLFSTPPPIIICMIFFSPSKVMKFCYFYMQYKRQKKHERTRQLWYGNIYQIMTNTKLELCNTFYLSTYVFMNFSKYNVIYVITFVYFPLTIWETFSFFCILVLRQKTEETQSFWYIQEKFGHIKTSPI